MLAVDGAKTSVADLGGFRRFRRVYELGGLEWWNGMVEWTTGVEYWTGLLDCHAHK